MKHHDVCYISEVCKRNCDKCSIARQEIGVVKDVDEKVHVARHVELHKYLDELVADYILDTNRTLSESSIFDLIKWSHAQAHPDKKD